jgi:hypothetical protein
VAQACRAASAPGSATGQQDPLPPVISSRFSEPHSSIVAHGRKRPTNHNADADRPDAKGPHANRDPGRHQRQRLTEPNFPGTQDRSQLA